MAWRKGLSDASARPFRARRAMKAAFEEALVEHPELLLSAAAVLPDPGDHPVLAAALKT